jgi:hypothetical protein
MSCWLRVTLVRGFAAPGANEGASELRRSRGANYDGAFVIGPAKPNMGKACRRLEARPALRPK